MMAAELKDTQYVVLVPLGAGDTVHIDAVLDNGDAARFTLSREQALLLAQQLLDAVVVLDEQPLVN